jgi:polysaccharide biosynthesis transport protein
MREPPRSALPSPPQGPDLGDLPPELIIGQAQPQPTLLYFWGIFRRNLWVTLLSGATVASAVGLYTTRIPHTYRASSSIRVDDRRMSLLAVDQVAIGSEITTEMEMLRSRSLAEQVVHQLGLRLEVVKPERTERSTLLDSISVSDEADSGTYIARSTGSRDLDADEDQPGATLVGVGSDGWVRLPGVAFRLKSAASRSSAIRVRVTPLAAAVEAFRASLRVSRLGNDANIVVVESRGSDPSLLRDLVNATAAGFIERRQEVERREARTRVAFLREQLDTLKSQLALAEDALRRYRQRAQVTDLQVEASSQLSRLVQMQGERSVLDAEREALAQLLEEVQTAAAQAGPAQPSPYRRLMAFPTLFRNQAASELLRSLGALEDQRSQLLTRRTGKDPDVQILTNRIGQVDEQLRTIGVTYLQGLTGQIASLDSTLRQFGSTLQMIPMKELRVAQLERTPKGLNQMYELVQGRLKEAEIAQAAIDPSVRIVDMADLPDQPVSPRPLLNVAAGFLIGLFLAFGVAVLRARNDPSVHTRADITRVTGMPVVGLIPRIPAMRSVEAGLQRRKRRRHGQKPEPVGAAANGALIRQHVPLTHLLSGVGGVGPIAQAFNRLDTYLSFAQPGSPLRTVLFTSPLTGDGKTTTAVNFAVALSLHGHRVLLVDTDLRRGIVHRIFGFHRDPGLSDLLSGTASLEHALRHVSLDPLDNQTTLTCLTAGSSQPRPEALLASPTMGSFLQRVRAEYDIVVLDSAPINVVTDAALLAGHVDGILVVVRAAVTADEALAYAVEQLRAVRAPVIGAVLNDVDLRRDASYDSTYKYHGYNDPYYDKVGG